MSRSSPHLAACLSLSALLSTVLPAAMANEQNAGPLDHPVELPGDEVRNTVTTLTPAVDARNNPIQSEQQLRTAVEEEQDELEQLPIGQLIVKAEQGERGAQALLGSVIAQDAALLSFAPAAANDALSAAARWYEMAASRGFPGAPSLDMAGVQHFPIRIQRELHP